MSLTNGYRDLRIHMYDHSGGVVTPCVNIVSNPNLYLHILSCLVFGNLDTNADPPQTEFPIDPLRALPTQPIGKILVNDHTYDILELIFSSQGLVGRGTVCYLARRLGQEYIIKDHWVLGDKEVALNEVAMLQAMKGVRGVPQLIEYWLVETKAQEVDETMNYRGKIWQSIKGTSRTHVRLVLKPRARPLHMFRTKVELVSAIRDIIRSEY
ncbi:hypothetical protein EDD22DRAFT_785476 [Suillus occidentalis]|nr:hypothetical protein EDD22DRAFT_785476 [Suillus occidentalis]